MVDYSKWEHLDLSSDEDDRKDSPHVTVFDRPQSVTISGNQPAKAKESSGTSTTPVLPVPGPLSTTRPETTLDHLTATQNGGATDHYLWGQSATEVTAYIFIENAVKGRDLSVEITPVPVHPLDNVGDVRVGFPEHLENNTGRCLRITHQDKSGALAVILEGRVPYPVKIEEVLWEIKTYDRLINLPDNQQTFQKDSEGHSQGNSISPAPVLPSTTFRAIVLTVPKGSLIAGTQVWWDRFLEGDAAIDTTTIPGRRHQTSPKSFKEVWDEAHKKFLEKVANTQPQEILIGSEDAPP